MPKTTNLNIELVENENEVWGDHLRADFELLDDLGKLLVLPVPVRFDPETGQTFFDSWYVPENITIFRVSVDASAGAPGGDLIGDLLVDGAAQSKAFTLAGAATKQKTDYGTPLNVNAGQRVGLQWTTVPTDPGLVSAVLVYYQVRALA